MIEVRNGIIYLDGFKTNFDVRELVPKVTYQKFGNLSIRFIQRSALQWLQFSRSFFDAPHIVNNWHVGGNLNLRGYRPPDAGFLRRLKRNGFGDYSKKLRRELAEKGFDLELLETGSWFSDHKMGIAFDYNVAGMTPDRTRSEILQNEELFMDYGLTTIEHGDFAPSWVHGSARETGESTIQIIKP